MPWLSICVFGFLACLVVVPGAYAGWGLLGLTLAGFALLGARWRGLTPDVWPWLATLLWMGLHGVLDAWRSGAPLGHQTVASLPWWPLAAAVWLLAWRGRPASLCWLWAGSCIGALGAGVLALYERLVFGVERASGGLNAIPFGNLSLLLGTLALVGALHGMAQAQDHGPGMGGISRWGWLAAGGGALASLLSGTRGGWITLPLVAGLLYGHVGRQQVHGAWRSLPPTARWALSAAALCLLVLVGWHVVPRMADLVRDIQLYLAAGRADTSIGLRFDMWRTAIALFWENPLLGWGESAMAPKLMALIDSGDLDAQAQYFGFQLHNDWLDTAARRGLLGLVGVALWYGVPLLGFARRWRHATDPLAGSVALAGLLTVVMFLGFGLTQSQLRDEYAFAAYLVLVTALWRGVDRPGAAFS